MKNIYSIFCTSLLVIAFGVVAEQSAMPVSTSITTIKPAETQNSGGNQSVTSAPTIKPAETQDSSSNQSATYRELEKQQWLHQNELLTQRNKLLEEAQASILNTVYWALSAVFGMAFLLAGFSWLNNHKLYSVEKEHTKNEMEARIAQVTNELQLKEQELRTALLSSIDTKLESQSNRLSNDMLDIRLSIENFRETIEAVSTFSETLKTDLEKKLSTAKQQIDKGIAVTREVEEHIWQLKGVPQNILITQGQGLSASLAAKDEEGVKHVLTRIKKTIEKEFITKNIKIKPLASLNYRLEVAQEMLPIEASEIIQLIQANTVE